MCQLHIAKFKSLCFPSSQQGPGSNGAAGNLEVEVGMGGVPMEPTVHGCFLFIYLRFQNLEVWLKCIFVMRLLCMLGFC